MHSINNHHPILLHQTMDTNIVAYSFSFVVSYESCDCLSTILQYFYISINIRIIYLRNRFHLISKYRTDIKYKYIINDKDFSIIYFFVIPEYVFLVELLVFHPILLNIDVENNYLDSMCDIMNHLHTLDLFVRTNYE